MPNLSDILSYLPDAEDVRGKLASLLDYDNLRTAGEVASMTPTPLGDVASGMLAVDDLRKGDYLGAAGNAVGLLPFVPAMGGVIQKMSPDEFLSLAKKFDPVWGGMPKKESIDYAKKGNLGGAYLTVVDTPKGLRVGMHDGRHRALAHKELGLKEMEVDIRKGQRMKREMPDLTEDELIRMIKNQGRLLPE